MTKIKIFVDPTKLPVAVFRVPLPSWLLSPHPNLPPRRGKEQEGRSASRVKTRQTAERSRERKSGRIFICVLSLFFLSNFPAYAQLPRKLILGMASISGGIETLYVTKKTGAFKRNGLDIDMVLFQGGSQALQALLSGDVKLISGGGGTAAQRARMQGAGNVIVATYTPTMPYSLYVRKEIKEAKQLKGGKVAVSRFGSSSDFAVRFILSKLGLDPGKDVTIMQIGNQQARFTALITGVVDGSVIDSPNTLMAKRQGFVQMADASSLGLAYPHNNITTTVSFIREESGTVMNFLRAFAEGIAYYKTHRAESIQMIKEFLRVQDDGIAEEAYDYFSRITPAKPYPSIEGVRTVLADMAKTDSAAKSVKPEEFIDSSFVKKLDESSYIDRLYGKN